MMSIAELVKALRMSAWVNAGLEDLTSAATEAAEGAAADVPKNGFKPEPAGKVVCTPSAPVISGLLRTVPPVDEKFPGVIGDPSALKKTRRGPSEVNNSTPLVALKGFGNGPVGKPAEKGAAAGVAATEYTPTPSAEE